MPSDKPWEDHTAAEWRAQAEAAGLTDLAPSLNRRQLYTALMQHAAAQVAAAAGNRPPGEEYLDDVAQAAADYRAAEAARLAARDEATDDAMDRWRNPAPEDVDVLDHARERAAGTDLVPSRFPTQSEWARIQTIASDIERGNLVRSRHLNTVADVTVILMAGRDLGVTPTMALQQIHVIDGRATLSAQLMVALVRSAGYSILPAEMTATRAVAKGTRLDETVEFEFTIEEAIAAGLCSRNGDGSLRGKDNWVHYPKAMLWARAVSGLCRILFPDVLAGLTYTPEEIGDSEWSDDVPTRVASEATTERTAPAPSARMLDDLEKAQLQARAMELPEEARARLNELWREAGAARRLHRMDSLDESDLPVIEELYAIVFTEHPDARPTPPSGDAVPDPEPDPGDSTDAATGRPVVTETTVLDAPAADEAEVLCPGCGVSERERSEGCMVGEHPF